MSIITPVAIPAPNLPLADPADRATFTARKLEHLRWEREDLAPGALALAEASYANALDAQANAVQVEANAATVATNTALAASYAGAINWVSGTTYAIGDRRISPANGLIYRRTIAGAGTTDPSTDTTNWTPVALNAPAQVITAAAVTAVSGQCLALTNATAQAASTNLLLYSEQYDNAVWGKSNMTVSTNVAVAPDGTTTADKYTPNNTQAASWSPQSVTASAGTYTISGHLSDAGGGSLCIYFYSLEHGDNLAVFNTLTGAVTGKSGPLFTSAATTSVFLGNGWYRVSVTFTTTGMTSFQCGLRHQGWTGDGTKGVYVWGLQLEAGSSATSYIQSVASQGTRAAGVVAPQRIVLPSNPAADAWVKVVVANGIATNMIDPNGKQFMGANGVVSGPIQLDNAGFSGALQFINGYWRFV